MCVVDCPTTMDGNKKIPFEIKNVESKLAAELMTLFTGENSGFVRVGPQGYFLPKKYEEYASDIYNMPVRASDVFVVTYPRSGTTLTQELVWLIANNLDYGKAAETQIMERFPFLELPVLIDSTTLKLIEKENNGDKEMQDMLSKLAESVTEQLAQMPSPRFIKTHLPPSLLPPNLLDTAKVVFVARDPRDVAVSFYHHNRLIRLHGYVGDFKTYWNYFINGLIYYTPFFEYIKEAWDKRHHPNMLFLFYEELSKDLPSSVQRVAEFLGKQLSEAEVARLAEHLKFDNFKNNTSVNCEELQGTGITVSGEQAFIRKGAAGGWRAYFDAEMTQQAERWIEDNLRGTDLRFPH